MVSTMRCPPCDAYLPLELAEDVLDVGTESGLCCLRVFLSEVLLQLRHISEGCHAQGADEPLILRHGRTGRQGGREGGRGRYGYTHTSLTMLYALGLGPTTSYMQEQRDQ